MMGGGQGGNNWERQGGEHETERKKPRLESRPACFQSFPKKERGEVRAEDFQLGVITRNKQALFTWAANAGVN